MTRWKRRVSRGRRQFGRQPSPLALLRPAGPIPALMPIIGTDGRVPKAAQPRPTEPSFVHIAVLVEQEQPESQDELEALISQYLVPGRKPSSPRQLSPGIRPRNWRMTAGSSARSRSARSRLERRWRSHLTRWMDIFYWHTTRLRGNRRLLCVSRPWQQGNGCSAPISWMSTRTDFGTRR